jgi:hypothetical protein
MEALYYDYLDMYCAVKRRYLHKLVDFIVDTCNEMRTDVDNRLFTTSDLAFLNRFKQPGIKQKLYQQTKASDKGASVYTRLLLDMFQVVKKLSYEDQAIVCENFERLKLNENFRNDSAVRGLYEPVEQTPRQEKVLTVLFSKQGRKTTSSCPV